MTPKQYVSQFLVPNNPNEAALLTHNLLLACWILQKLEYRIQKSTLFELVGINYEQMINFILTRDFNTYGYIDKGDENFLVLKSELMDAIEACLNNKNYNLHLTEAIPYFDKRITNFSKEIDGINFLASINNLEGHIVLGHEFTILLANALKMALPGTSFNFPYERDYPSIALVEGPSSLWRFLLLVYPVRGEMNKDEIDSSSTAISRVRDKLKSQYGYEDLQALLVAPAAGVTDLQLVSEYQPYIKFLWSISAIRLFFALKVEFSNDTSLQQRFAEIFMAIFDSEDINNIDNLIVELKKNL